VRSSREPSPTGATLSFAPIALGVFAQMLGEGIAISSLPLHMTSLGASPVLVGGATSCFSVAQMFCCPLLVRLSTRLGRTRILRTCLAGAAASSLLIAWSGTTLGIITGRCLAGVFAASVPVAQAAVTDVVPANQTALALSRVSAASQLGVVVGPAAAAMLQAAFAAMGVPTHLRLRAVFLTAAAFAIGVLALSRPGGIPGGGGGSEGRIRGGAPGRSGGSPGQAATAPTPAAPPSPPSSPPAAPPWPLTQPCLRLIAGVVGWGLTLSVGTYGLFAPRILGYAQPQLSLTFSVGAAVTVLTQVMFPRIVSRVGEWQLKGLQLGLGGV
jgi:MFS family permease